ncbi:pyridoxal-dependent decarboxylase domain protein [Calocera cornea HHB12733]|uniref:Pyridoxal-dependent decarboxylase domain protein n=1 Tax=Calocera cornea HHB12733 TaxID=1353952 RepID=A0A165FVS3_9BASI|nr:pyridoxal-dependent decarboxylase domain protein [Calocera cornea HHB12733]
MPLPAVPPGHSVALDHDAISALFLGPKAENFELLKELFGHVLDKQKVVRQNYHREDEDFISATIMESDSYKNMKDRLIDSLDKMTTLLNMHSVPFFSPRYSAHMCTDMSLPGILGYISTMIFNPNNVAFEASPITTVMELEAGKDMCRMLGYKVDAALDIPGTEDVPVAWGHIACDGTVANLEALWSARNLKFYPLSLRDAMAPKAPLNAIADKFFVTITGKSKERKLFRELNTWELLNLTPSVVNGLPQRLYDEFGISSSFLEQVMEKYSIQTVGKDDVERRWGITDPLQLLITSTKHYSWPKGAAILGIGKQNCYDISVDEEARVDIKALRNELYARLEKKRPIYMVVAVIGSTEEGAVDPLKDIIALRDEMEQQGMSFLVHADAAWGGYFASMIRHPKDPGTGLPREAVLPRVHLRPKVAEDLQHLGLADSITIDPHKAGYIPYPAGGLCYRDGRQRYLVTWTAPYLHQDTSGESIGIYGVEGSKPGASPGAVYLAHRVIGTDANGYGALLREAAFNCRRFAAHWSAMSTEQSVYVVVPFNPIPAERAGASSEDIELQKKYIRDQILPRSDAELLADGQAMAILNELGSDLNINIFGCNFRLEDGTINTDIELANNLNWRIFQRLSVTDFQEDPTTIPFYVTATKLAQEEYKVCATNFKKRLGLEGDQDIFVLRNVVMSPFGSTDNFVAKLAEIFKEVLSSEIEVVRQRALPQKMVHKFIMQGDQQLFFVYMPSLYRTGEGYQTIFTADVDTSALQLYRKAKQDDPNATFVLQNVVDVTLDQLLSGAPFKASISIWKNGHLTATAIVSNVKIVKKRPLRTTTYDSTYPHEMPFYLYGAKDELHMDHMLLLAPNIQLTAGDVQFSTPLTLRTEDLEKASIAIAKEIPEDWMQPFPEKNSQLPGESFFFRRGKKLAVTLYEDPYAPDYDGKIDLSRLSHPIAQGEITLRGQIYIDSEDLNADSTFQPLPVTKPDHEGSVPMPLPVGRWTSHEDRRRQGAFTSTERASRWHDHFRDVMDEGR